MSKVEKLVDETIVSNNNIGQEHIRGVISGVSRRRKVLGVENYDIVVTNKRLIFVPVPQSNGRNLNYFALSPEMVLANDVHNSAIKRDEIKSIKLTAGQSYNDCCGKRQNEDGNLEISAGKKYTFLLPYYIYPKVESVLKETNLI